MKTSEYRKRLRVHAEAIHEAILKCLKDDIAHQDMTWNFGLIHGHIMNVRDLVYGAGAVVEEDET